MTARAPESLSDFTIGPCPDIPQQWRWLCPCGVGQSGFSEEDTAAGYADEHLHVEHRPERVEAVAS